MHQGAAETGPSVLTQLDKDNNIAVLTETAGGRSRLTLVLETIENRNTLLEQPKYY